MLQSRRQDCCADFTSLVQEPDSIKHKIKWFGLKQN